MRDVSMDDGFGLPEIDGGEAGTLDDVGASVDVDGFDAGFDFLGEIEAERSGANGSPVRRGAATDGMSDDDIAEFRSRWADVQASFIDDPGRACEQADNLVDLVLKRLTERFARERDDLVRKWDHGNEPTDTEDLRVAMKGYRGLIDRLLTTRI